MKHTPLSTHLAEHAKVRDDLRHLILRVADAAKYIQQELRTTEAGIAGTKNMYGEEQIKLDVFSNDVIERELRESGLAGSYISEEQEEVVELKKDAPYSVVFDPLDGSSLVEANFAIGSIFGIYEGDLIGKKPGEQIAALYVLYGPRTILVYSAGKGVHEFILNDVGEFTLLRENLGIGDEAKNFSAGNLVAVNDNPGYRKILEHWLKEKLTLRYSGCLVADAHHILSKGQGVFVNLGGGKYPDGKLRFVFEVGPFAYLIEQAGGKSSDGAISLLEKKIKQIDQRSQIIIGSSNEVERIVRLLQSQ
jgi:fructose-1,6-bisphosphatase I